MVSQSTNPMAPSKKASSTRASVAKEFEPLPAEALVVRDIIYSDNENCRSVDSSDSEDIFLHGQSDKAHTPLCWRFPQTWKYRNMITIPFGLQNLLSESRVARIQNFRRWAVLHLLSVFTRLQSLFSLQNPGSSWSCCYLPSQLAA